MNTTAASEATRLGLKFLQFESNGTQHVGIKPENAEELRRILNALKPSTNTVTLKGAETIDRPYRLDLINPATFTHWTHMLSIRFKMEDADVVIDCDVENLPRKFVSLFMAAGVRLVRGTERGYFDGLPKEDVEAMQVQAYGWKASKVRTWYTGNVTLLDAQTIDHAINYLKG